MPENHPSSFGLVHYSGRPPSKYVWGHRDRAYNARRVLEKVFEFLKEDWNSPGNGSTCLRVLSGMLILNLLL
jgi:hypothetical protein